MLGPNGEREIWTLATVNATYIRRVTDFTQTGGLPLEAPDVSEGYYTAGPTDGAVANFNWDSVYLPTFGGVVRWDVSGPEPVPVESSYQPGSFAGDAHSIEDLELLDMSGSGDWHLLAPTADGSFFAWPVDATTHDPLPGARPAPPSGYWNFVANAYGNDVDIATHPGTGFEWVLFDYSSFGDGVIGMGLYNWTQGFWSNAPITYDDPPAGPSGVIKPLVQDLEVHENWVFMACVGGFLVCNLNTMQITDAVYVAGNEVCGQSFDTVHGIDLYEVPGTGDLRVFASLGGDSEGFGFAMYAFDDTTGDVVDPVTGLTTDTPMQCLFDGPGGDDYPGVFLAEGGKISVVTLPTTPPATRVYSATTNGSVVEMLYANDALTPHSYWNNGKYFEEIMDCNAYVVPTGEGYSVRIVVAKRSETFEVVTGYGL